MVEEGFSDDLEHAQHVAAHLGVALSEIRVAPPSAEDLAGMVRTLDEPEADPAPLYVEAIARVARADGIKVLLGGTGGDDIFTGYRRHKAAALRARAGGVAGAGAVALRLLGRFASGPASRRLAKLRYLFTGSDEEFLLRAFEFVPRADGLACLSADARAQIAADTSDWLEQAIVRSRGRPLVDRMLSLELQGFLPDHNLNYTDKAAMAHGVEVRVPLLDNRLVAFSRIIPWQLKTTLLDEKWIFKQAVAPRLPSAVVTRTKTGFGGPVRHWIAGPLRGLVDDVITSRSFHDRGLFDRAAIERTFARTIDGRQDGAYQIFAVVLAELWMRAFVDYSDTPVSPVGTRPLNNEMFSVLPKR
jgi:asparagine synthase (glutamine-hydrolysing)